MSTKKNIAADNEPIYIGPAERDMHADNNTQASQQVPSGMDERTAFIAAIRKLHNLHPSIKDENIPEVLPEMWAVWQARAVLAAQPSQAGGDGAKDAQMPKLTLALPAFENRRVIVASDELIDDERTVCIAIDDNGCVVIPKGSVLVPDADNMTDEQAEAIAKVANCCGGIAYDIYRAAIAAGKHKGE